jgi:ATF/CREB family transcription factor
LSLIANTITADTQTDTKTDVALKPELSTTTNTDAAKPLAPPPRPAQQTGNTPDYFSSQLGGSLSLEPNPFEQSFGAPETPGGTKLPSVAALTSPSSLLPGTGVTPFGWGGGSLRTGPLSPAMLSGPTNDYFGDAHNIRGGFPTPNESSMRTGLTPGGSGSMFPAPSPNSQALFAQLASNGATPGTIDFHRTALNAAAAKRDQQTHNSVTSAPQEMPNGIATKSGHKGPAGSFDPTITTHDNDAANGLFMLARGRDVQQGNQYAVAPPQQVIPQPPLPPPANMKSSTSPTMTNGRGSIAASSTRGISEAGSAGSEESEQQPRPTTRGRGKRNSTAGGATTNGRRKADDQPKAPASKKSKTNGGGSVASVNGDDMMDHDMPSDEEDMKINKDGTKTKMTDEEKRKNFLERNRYVIMTSRPRL